MLRILIVDDSWLTRRIIGRVLKSAGHEVLEADDGMEGLETAEAEAPDCILLDLLMPGMDGFDVLRAMTERGLSIPVVVVTADIQETSRRQCIELGVTGFLNKPAKDEELIEAVRGAVGSRKGPM